MDKRPKVALVLTGGGARGAYQAGFLRGLAEMLPGKIPFSILSGISVGAINAAYVACHADDWLEGSKKLWNAWGNLRPEGIFIPKRHALRRIAFRWFVQVVLGYKKKIVVPLTLLDNMPLQQLLSSEIDFNAIRDHVQSGHLHGVGFTATDFIRRTSTTFFDGSKDIQSWENSERLGKRSVLSVRHVVASVALPLLFEPVKIGDTFFGDGSIHQASPLSPAVHLGADKILVVATHEHESKQKIEMLEPPSFGAVLGMLLRSAFSDALDIDLRRLATGNQLAVASPHETNLRDIPSLELRPSLDLGELASKCCYALPSSLQRIIRLVGGTQDDDQTFLSYVAFEKAYTVPLLEAGYKDALAARTRLETFLNR